MAVQELFPTMETVFDEQIEVIFSPTGEPTHNRINSPRLRFFNESRTSLIQLGQDGNVLTFNVLKPYPGWEALRATVESLWPKLRDILKPQKIGRVGLRYINRIERSQEFPLLSDWLKPNDYLPKAVVASRSPYNFNASVEDAEGRQLNIRVGEPEPGGATIFDIDVVSKRSHSPETEELISTLNHLHDEEWSVFEGSITETFMRHLRGAQG